MLGEKPERDDDSVSVLVGAGKTANSAPTAALPRDVCLLGYAEETRDLVFELPETTEIWAINMAHVFIFGAGGPKTRARAKYWFQMHPRNWSAAGKSPTGYFGRPKEHLDFLATFDGTVWMQSVDPDVPNSVRFPLEDIVAASGRSYFTSSFAYQLALAWYEHAVLGRPSANCECTA